MVENTVVYCGFRAVNEASDSNSTTYKGNFKCGIYEKKFKVKLEIGSSFTLSLFLIVSLVIYFLSTLLTYV